MESKSWTVIDTTSLMPPFRLTSKFEFGSQNFSCVYAMRWNRFLILSIVSKLMMIFTDYFQAFGIFVLKMTTLMIDYCQISAQTQRIAQLCLLSSVNISFENGIWTYKIEYWTTWTLWPHLNMKRRYAIKGHPMEQ